MIKMRMLFVVFYLLLASTAFSQVQARYDGMVYLNKNENTLGEDAKKNGYYVGPHVLGDTITMLLNRFEKDFVYFETGDGAYGVEEKKIIKPDLYNAIKKIEKFYSKSLKKELVEETFAYSRLKLVLQRGIRLKNFDTSVVEKDLKRMKSVEDMENYILELKFKS